MKETSACKTPDDKWLHLGLLLLRLGIGAAFLFVHGGPKLLAGPEKWEKLGGAMAVFGITFAPVFWGFMAAISEALGGLLLMVGLLVRPSAFLMLITMIVATGLHMSNGSSYMHPLEMSLVFLALTVSGGGRYAVPCPLSCCTSRKETLEAAPSDAETK